MNYKSTPPSESKRRISLLQDGLTGQSLDGAIFVSPVDIYYFAGTRQNGALWIPASGEPVLLVRKSFMRASAESLIPDTRPFPPSRDLPGIFDGGVRRIGITFDVMPVQYYQYYTRLMPSQEFVDISLLHRQLRSVKSLWEQQRMRESGRRLAAVFAEIPTFLKRGMRELDLAAEMECILRRSGSEGSIRLRSFGQEIIGLSSSGAQAAAPGGFDGPVTGQGVSASAPYGPSDAVIADNVPIIIDYSGTYDGYMVDMTRIFVFGKLDKAMTTAFDAAIEIQGRLTGMMRPGAVCEELYFEARRIAEDAGLSSQFMGNPAEQARFVGHGVGLELDELPVLAEGFDFPLQEGQTVAVEPKFIFRDAGVVGIENTWLVTTSGSEKLTGLPDEVICL